MAGTPTAVARLGSSVKSGFRGREGSGLEANFPSGHAAFQSVEAALQGIEAAFQGIETSIDPAELNGWKIGEFRALVSRHRVPGGVEVFGNNEK